MNDEKWKNIIGGLTGSKADWLKEYCNRTIVGDLDPNSINTGITNDLENIEFPILPMAIKIAASTIGTDLVSVQPMNSTPSDELDRIAREVKMKNRDSKIDSILEDKLYEEFKIENHPNYKSGPKGVLFYLDFNYGSTSSSI